MKKYKRIVASIGFILLFLIAWGYFNIWRSPKYFMEQNGCEKFQHILSMEQYEQLSDSHERPYIINSNGVFIFGAEHIKDPNHQQNKEIENAFQKFNPTVVLVEGRLGFFIPYFMDPVEKFGEMGKVAALAKQRGLPVYSWDAPKNEQLNVLREKFEDEQIALKEILNPYFSNLRFGKPVSPEKYVEQYLIRAEWLGVQDVINSIADIDTIWKRDFPKEMDWRETSDQWGLPGYLSDLAAESNFIRNQHLVCVINLLREQGERVFVICGSSHAVSVKNEFTQ